MWTSSPRTHILQTRSPRTTSIYNYIPFVWTSIPHFDTQSSTLLRSRCPNHLNLPCLTTSATFSIPNSTNSHFAFYPSVTPRTSISPSYAPSSPVYADFQPSSPMFQSHMSTHSGHKLCIYSLLYDMMHHGLSEWEIIP